MQAGNTLQVRAAINAAFDELKHHKRRTWTDQVKWGHFDGPSRVVTYQTVYAHEIAAIAQKNLQLAGFNNEVRVTEADIKRRAGCGPYIRVVTFMT